MKILVTGAKGFVGKNLVAELKNRGHNEIYECDINTTSEELIEFTKDCEFVFHLAGVNRPEKEDDFMKGNFGFTSILLNNLKKNNNKSPILITSSIQAKLDNPYGKSKKAGEDLIFKYSKDNSVRTYVYRLPNLFGKWCRPNYNSVVATFCHNIANHLPIQINDSEAILNLAYIDDVLNEFINAMDNNASMDDNYGYIPVTHSIKLGELAKMIIKFEESRKNLQILNMQDNELEKKLYSTYLSYLPENEFSYPVKMNVDNRGSFTELFKTAERGQVSVNISKPGIVKGNHWHHTKNEKFVVVSGEGIIRFRRIDSDKVIEYKVSGEKIEIVDIPCGYTHNIENIGNTDMVTVMWANEVYNPEKPDTFYMEV